MERLRRRLQAGQELAAILQATASDTSTAASGTPRLSPGQKARVRQLKDVLFDAPVAPTRRPISPIPPRRVSSGSIRIPRRFYRPTPRRSFLQEQKEASP